MANYTIQEQINRIETEIVQRTQGIWASEVQLNFNGYISTYGPIQIICNPTEKYILGILEDGTKNYSTEVVGVIQELQTDLSIANNIFEPNTNYDPDDNKDGNHDNDDIYDTMSITELKQNKIAVYQQLSNKQTSDWTEYLQKSMQNFINYYQPIIFKTVDGIEYIIDETADFSQASTIVLTYTQPEPEVGDDTVPENETDEDLLPSNSNI
jgi:hypothetical protein